MKLGFTPEQEALRADFARLLARGDRRAALADTGVAAGNTGPADAALWRALAEGGWLAAAWPESRGGSGLDAPTLCVLAEEAGRALSAVPFVASACAFVHGLQLADGEGMAPDALGAALADGSARGVLLTDDCWPQPPQLSGAGVLSLELSGCARQVPDAASATHALACVGEGEGARLLLLQLQFDQLAAPGAALDLLHPSGDLHFASHAAQVLARGAQALARWQAACDAQAVFVAFEQLGGAEAALQAARAYSLQRYAFGRPIGSFQALKHLMADMLVAVELARSNCLYGAAVLASRSDELSEAAAVARISATEAFRSCAIGSTQVHGAIGVTWEADCHLFYRRAQALAGTPGSLASWKHRLVGLLQQRAAAA
ncbi:acyl-CoA dehydrogenase family protein [Aquabacterium sp.]|uniref:acyl-CoA dehydrogenase family protein n=1 Tax=Aquabacterium sp. TaxID=1872578 RepID=UPI002C26C25B|nr:acyl-CoA dehydrogenase family protein [Aquabacterium sp.]HSW04943.1 acyl-CoA dehydrogenase family protein [Aquabacterium sp.]